MSYLEGVLSLRIEKKKSNVDVGAKKEETREELQCGASCNNCVIPLYITPVPPHDANSSRTWTDDLFFYTPLPPSHVAPIQPILCQCGQGERAPLVLPGSEPASFLRIDHSGNKTSLYSLSFFILPFALFDLQCLGFLQEYCSIWPTTYIQLILLPHRTIHRVTFRHPEFEQNCHIFSE